MAKPSADNRDRAGESGPEGIYRTNARPTTEAPPPRELVYAAPGDRGRITSSKVWFLGFAIPLLAYVIVSRLAGSPSGLVAALAAAALVFWRRRTRDRAAGKLLYVENGVLSVEPRNAKSRGARFPLHELDVVLDTKTIRKLVDGDSMLPAVRFAQSKVGPEIDMARIVLTNAHERYTLSDQFVSHTEAIEWFGKIRVFLRRHGWVPADERDGADF